MNFSQLQTLVLSWLDDPNAGYFTLPQVNVWLNNAQKEVQKLLIRSGNNDYVTKMSGQLVANQDTYVLPTDFKKCHKFEIVTGGTAGNVDENRNTLAFVTLVQLEAVSQTTGLPQAYNIRRNLITLRPVPDSIYTVYLSQSYAVTDMVNPLDLPDVPEDYTEYIAVIATLDGFLKDQRDPTPFVVAKKDKYETMLARDAQERNVSQPRYIVSTEWGDGYGTSW